MGLGDPPLDRMCHFFLFFREMSIAKAKYGLRQEGFLSIFNSFQGQLVAFLFPTTLIQSVISRHSHFAGGAKQELNKCDLWCELQ